MDSIIGSAGSCFPSFECDEPTVVKGDRRALAWVAACGSPSYLLDLVASSEGRRTTD